ncbi:hypothetical protein DQ403_01870 [Stutzerimonas zhaodongensis]|uniref:Uncharacterized protein n=1 Tax=Stutzerimonas zhaodongensis TaxID=1176257 RepID=A0A365PZH6_9GAMM|nr:hypothetical protein DQ403_01870 [Stutzerimonas zhaodongensis]
MKFTKPIALILAIGFQRKLLRKSLLTASLGCCQLGTYSFRSKILPMDLTTITFTNAPYAIALAARAPITTHETKLYIPKKT